MDKKRSLQPIKVYIEYAKGTLMDGYGIAVMWLRFRNYFTESVSIAELEPLGLFIKRMKHLLCLTVVAVDEKTNLTIPTQYHNQLDEEFCSFTLFRYQFRFQCRILKKLLPVHQKKIAEPYH